MELKKKFYKSLMILSRILVNFIPQTLCDDLIFKNKYNNDFQTLCKLNLRRAVIRDVT